MKSFPTVLLQEFQHCDHKGISAFVETLIKASSLNHARCCFSYSSLSGICALLNNFNLFLCFCSMLTHVCCSYFCKISFQPSQVLQSRNFLRSNKMLGSFKLDVATVWAQPGTVEV